MRTGKLYVIFGEEFVSPERYGDFVLEIFGFAAMVQLREKNVSAREFVRRAVKIRKILEKKKIPLIINDKVDVAYEAKADGVHLGQKDVSVETARKILGKGAIIGLSVETAGQAKKAVKMPLNYISASPVFATGSKDDAARPLGIPGLKKIKAAAGKIPVFAIGGISAYNAFDVMKAGADGISVISAVCGARNPGNAARELKKIIST